LRLSNFQGETKMPKLFERIAGCLLIGVTLLTACLSVTSPVPDTPTPTPQPPSRTSAELTAPANVSVTVVPTETNALKKMLAALVAEWGFNGSVLVAQQGQVLISEGFGLADREHDVPNTPQTRFGIGSITKSFTALAIMILQERGQLAVQDSVCKYLSDCPSAWKLITLHQLLNHTSGIPDFTGSSFGFLYPRAWNNKVNTCREYPPEEITAYFKDLPLDFTPGSQWSYSNSGYFLLGIIIEKVSGETYESFIQKNILQPLGMTETGYDRSSAIVKNHASGYSFDRDQGQLINAPCMDASIKYAAGGLYSTVGDLYKWDQALYTNRLVSAETLSTIFTSTVRIPYLAEALYGYGWAISQPSGYRVIEHDGLVPGFASDLARYPEKPATIIVLSNVDTSDPSHILKVLAATLFGE
jgi:CubicO group peptidase (beta-lactamase class C family)